MKALTLLLILATLAPVHAGTTPPSKKGAAGQSTKASKGNSAKPEAKVQATPKSAPKSKAKASASAASKTPAPVSPEHPAFSRMTPEERLRLQVFLDRSLFAPGKVDGLNGEFTVKAAQRWISAAPGRSLDGLLQAAREMTARPVTTFTIPADAARSIGKLPASLPDQAAAKRLPYASISEYLAERFHTDEAMLSRLNPMIDVDHAAEGDVLRVPNVVPFKIEAPRMDSSAATRLSGAEVRILHNDHMLEVRQEAGMLVAAFPITVGGKPEHVRSGEWKIMSLSPNPTFTWDAQMLKKGVKGDKQYLLPPGPNNPVGVLWMELEPVKGPEAHIGIHGTNDPTHIGRNQSSGCIRLANWDVVRLARLIGPGTRVAWKPQPDVSDLMLARSF